MSSLFTPRAISYRIKMGFPHEKVLISVGVQKIVDARAAGVMFTLNPTQWRSIESGHRRELGIGGDRRFRDL